MCGIAVAIDWPDAEAVVRQLVDGILHRGDITDPIFSPRPNSAMCTRRLRIVDAENAIQPQLSPDGRIAVAFNGEIYNYLELRRELRELGAIFKTESDTEVIACALQAWGPPALGKFVGMFAFVAIDMVTGEFLAARDTFGVKPLYVIQSPSGFLFCSEMRPLLEAVEVGDVMLLPPGYMLARNACVPFKTALGIPTLAPLPGDARSLDALLSEAVRSRLPLGLPVATMFSGGIDSTLIAHYARRFRPEMPGYFVGGEDAPDYRYAAAYADRTGFDLRCVPFDAGSERVFSLIDDVVEITESFEPNLIRGAVCSLAVSEKIHRDGFRVALCGEGADELFCGYPPLEIAFQDDFTVGQALRNECLGLMHRISLQRVDRCSMRYQLETREPFLDPSIVNFALNADPSAHVGNVGGRIVGKRLLREIYNLYPDELPALIRDRTKVPFGEGAGLDATPEGSSWKLRFNEAFG
ncbi:MAG: asparagine synthetase B [Rhizobiales bacterium]|nr:asparagine synthetase B [Hyphomicrobiales bacterium]